MYSTAHLSILNLANIKHQLSSQKAWIAEKTARNRNITKQWYFLYLDPSFKIILGIFKGTEWRDFQKKFHESGSPSISVYWNFFCQNVSYTHRDFTRFRSFQRYLCHWRLFVKTLPACQPSTKCQSFLQKTFLKT